MPLRVARTVLRALPRAVPGRPSSPPFHTNSNNNNINNDNNTMLNNNNNHHHHNHNIIMHFRTPCQGACAVQSMKNSTTVKQHFLQRCVCVSGDFLLKWNPLNMNILLHFHIYIYIYIYILYRIYVLFTTIYEYTIFRIVAVIYLLFVAVFSLSLSLSELAVRPKAIFRLWIRGRWKRGHRLNKHVIIVVLYVMLC